MRWSSGVEPTNLEEFLGQQQCIHEYDDVPDGSHVLRCLTVFGANLFLCFVRHRSVHRNRRRTIFLINTQNEQREERHINCVVEQTEKEKLSNPSPFQKYECLAEWMLEYPLLANLDERQQQFRLSPFGVWHQQAQIELYFAIDVTDFVFIDLDR